jgi:hypothetical protein
VDDFQKAFKAKHSNRLSSVDDDKLFVYKNKEAFKRRRLAYQGNEKPLEPTKSLDSLGSKNDMLIVVVPLLTSTQSELDVVHHPVRKRRWETINDILEMHGKITKKRKSTPYSSIPWSIVKDVFDRTDYEQETLDIDNYKFKLLFQYITRVMKCL